MAIGAGLAMTTAGYVAGQLGASFTRNTRKVSRQPSKVGYRSAPA